MSEITIKQESIKTEINSSEKIKTNIIIKMEEDFDNTVIIVNPKTSSNKEKIRYSITKDANRKLILAYELLEKMKLDSELFGITKSEFNEIINKPIKKLLSGRVISRKKNNLNISSPFSKPREVNTKFISIYNNLKSEELDLTDIFYEDNKSSLVDSSKIIRKYINFKNLKDEKDGRKVYLDDYLINLFGKDVVNILYEKNKSEYITQGQIQSLATYLTIKN